MNKDLDLPGYMNQLYDYNYWANKRTLDIAGKLTSEQFFHQHGHSWGSVHGVLVHVLGAEWVWLSRWEGNSPRSLPIPEDYPTLESIRTRWAEVEEEMRNYVKEQTSASLMRAVTYTNTKGRTFTLILWEMMVHVVNHGTHHRGELAAMLAQMGVKHPEDEWLEYSLWRNGKFIK